MNRHLLTALLIVVVSVAGCATPTRYFSKVDSLARPDTFEKRRYLLVPGNSDVRESDLQFQEFASYVKVALRDKGFIEAASFENADVAIFVTYDIGDPQTHRYSYSVPIWGQTGVASRTTQGTVSAYGNTATYSGTTTYTPSYGMVGSSTQTSSYTTYSRFLTLDAYDIASYIEREEMIQIWRTSVVSTGSSDDLRLVMPYMIAAMKPHLGTNTAGRVEIVIPENDSRVRQVRDSARAAAEH